jgi:hypothetical protein
VAAGTGVPYRVAGGRCRRAAFSGAGLVAEERVAPTEAALLPRLRRLHMRPLLSATNSTLQSYDMPPLR